jgi:Predicted aminoglycoside phosphotransferase
MDSASKIVIERGTLGRISEKYLGRGIAGSYEIEEGWFNTIHVLELEDGRRAVLKVSPPPSFVVLRYERDILATEVAVHRRLAEAGLLAPKVLAYSPEGDFIGHPWFIMDYLEGEPLMRLRRKLSRRARDAIDGQVATQAAAVNGILGERFGRWREDQTASASWPESFLAMVEELFEDARDKQVGLPRPEAEVRSLIESARPALETVKEPRLVLWDLHDGNVIARADPPTMVGFLDTDRALWGDPLMEFYFRKLSFASQAWRSAYAEASLERGGPVDADERASTRCALYELYLALVMVIESAYRGYGLVHRAWTRAYCARAIGGLDRALARLR